MTARHQSRSIAFQILYQWDIGQRKTGEGLALVSDLNRELASHFSHFQVNETLRPFATELAMGTMAKLEEIDALIEKHASHWKVSRMSVVDRNILRMALYEVLCCPDIPHSVTLNEAIELGKEYGTEEAGPFINGVMDGILTALGKIPASQPEMAQNALEGTEAGNPFPLPLSSVTHSTGEALPLS